MNPDILSQLRDIHGAPPAPWWPPAPGWWVLALLLLVALAWLARALLNVRRKHVRRKQMLAWVDHLNATVDPARDPQAYLGTINRIFKLVALRAFPDQQCAVMAGEQWSEFLINRMANMPSVDSLRVLATGPYDPAPEFDAGVISELSRAWIKQHG